MAAMSVMENPSSKHWKNLEHMTEPLSRSLLVPDGNNHQPNAGFREARLVRFLTSPNLWSPFTSYYILLQSQCWLMPVSSASSLIFQNSGVLQLFLTTFCGAHHYMKGNCHRQHHTACIVWYLYIALYINSIVCRYFCIVLFYFF